MSYNYQAAPTKTVFDYGMRGDSTETIGYPGSGFATTQATDNKPPLQAVFDSAVKADRVCAVPPGEYLFKSGAILDLNGSDYWNKPGHKGLELHGESISNTRFIYYCTSSPSEAVTGGTTWLDKWETAPDAYLLSIKGGDDGSFAVYGNSGISNIAFINATYYSSALAKHDKAIRVYAVHRTILSRLLISSFKTAITVIGSDGTRIINSAIAECDTGIRFDRCATFIGDHHTVENTTFSSCRLWGMEGTLGSTQVFTAISMGQCGPRWDGVTLANNSTNGVFGGSGDSTDTTYGPGGAIKFKISGDAGHTGLCINGMYSEGHCGDSDIIFDNLNSQDITITIMNSKFARIGDVDPPTSVGSLPASGYPQYSTVIYAGNIYRNSAATGSACVWGTPICSQANGHTVFGYTNSIIKLMNSGGGKIKLVLIGNTFKDGSSVGYYKPDVTRPYIDFDPTKNEVIDIGNAWELCEKYPSNLGSFINNRHMTKINDGAITGLIEARNIDANNLSGYGEAKRGISWYAPAYLAWNDYMASPLGVAPSGGTPSSYGDVTSFARRFNAGTGTGYGWIWESNARNVNEAPLGKMALSANTGNLAVAGALTSAPRTVSALASLTPTEGMRAFVTDSTVNTFGSTVAGGGSYHVPVFRNASAWLVG